MMAASPAPTKAVAVVHALGDTKTAGKVTFTKVDGGIEIVADVTGLTPGKHGFHVHEFGDCSMMDGTCAGGHFNPDGMPHAGPDAAKRHVGDFGNLEADAEGNAHYSRVDKLITLSGPHSIIGRSIIVHGGAGRSDDAAFGQRRGPRGLWRDRHRRSQCEKVGSSSMATDAISPAAPAAVGESKRDAPFTRPRNLWPPLAMLALFWAFYLANDQLDMSMFARFMSRLGAHAPLLVGFFAWWLFAPQVELGRAAAGITGRARSARSSC